MLVTDTAGSLRLLYDAGYTCNNGLLCRLRNVVAVWLGVPFGSSEDRWIDTFVVDVRYTLLIISRSLPFHVLIARSAASVLFGMSWRCCFVADTTVSHCVRLWLVTALCFSSSCLICVVHSRILGTEPHSVELVL